MKNKLSPSARQYPVLIGLSIVALLFSWIPGAQAVTPAHLSAAAPAQTAAEALTPPLTAPKNVIGAEVVNSSSDLRLSLPFNLGADPASSARVFFADQSGANQMANCQTFETTCPLPTTGVRKTTGARFDTSRHLAFRSANLGLEGGAFTFAAYVNLDDPKRQQIIVSRGPYQMELLAGYEGNGLAFYPAGAQTAVYAPNVLVPGWNLIAAVYNGNTAQLYYNNRLVGTRAGLTGDNVGANPTDLNLGRRPDGSLPLQGVLDEVRLYNRALSDVDVLSLQGKTFVDLTIAFEPGTTAYDPNRRWAVEQVIFNLADAIYEMSNGGNVLRNVTLRANRQDWDNRLNYGANVYWYNFTNSNGCRAYSTLPKLAPTKYISICDYNQGWYYSLINWPARQSLGLSLAHEMGHYWYGMWDQYQEIGRPCDANRPFLACATDTPGWWSIMGQYDLAIAWWGFWDFFGAFQPIGDNNWLNFQNRPNENGNNASYRMFSASQWEVLARPPSQDPRDGARDSQRPRPYHPELAAFAPPLDQWYPTLEMNQPYAVYQSRGSLNLIWVPEKPAGVQALADGLQAANRVVREIVIDRTTTMSNTGYLADAKAAVAAQIAKMPAGDTLGILTYDGAVQTTLALTDVTDANRAALQAAVAGITPGAAAADPGQALASACTVFSDTVLPSDAYRMVYLITAGKMTTGAGFLASTPAYAEAEIPLYVFAFDPTESDGETLFEAADLTDGDYQVVGNTEQLLKALLETDETTAADAGYDLTTAYATVPAQVTHIFSTYVDSTLDWLDFYVDYYDAPEAATVEVVDPQGHVQTLDAADDCEDLSDPAADDWLTECYYAPAQARTGTWQVRVTADAEAVEAESWVVGGATDDTYYAKVDLVTGDNTRAAGEVAYPLPIVLRAQVGQALPIAGAVGTGVLWGPDDTARPFALHDDGVAPDSLANDGIYAAVVDYWMAGAYDVVVSFNNANGTGQYTDLSVQTKEYQPPIPVQENFERYATFQVNVVNWQVDAPAGGAVAGMQPAANAPVVLGAYNGAWSGRVDYAGDVDSYVVTPTTTAEPLYLRVDNLALGMAPKAHLASGAWQLDYACATCNPISKTFLFVPLTQAVDGQAITIELAHVNAAATTGYYDISVGPRLPSDPRPNTHAQVALSPGQEIQAPAGSTLVYRHTLTNTGTVADVYTVTIASVNGWEVTSAYIAPSGSASGAPTMTVPLNPQQTATLIFTTTLPVSAVLSQTSAINVTALSAVAPEWAYAPAVDTAIALPTVLAQFGRPGAVVTYTVRVTNTLSTTDTLNIAYRGNQWPTQLLTATPLTLTAGAASEIRIGVTLSLTVTAGAQDTSNLVVVSRAKSATSGADPLLVNAWLKTNVDDDEPAPPEPVYLPLVIR